MQNVLLIGATGHLGAMIAHELLKRGTRLKLLVRESSLPTLDPEISAASEVITDEEKAFMSIDTVVSAVQGGPETIVDTQLNWLRASREAGVRRFIPSDYSYNIFNVPDGANINTDWRRAFAEKARAVRGPVELVHIFNGCFIDINVLFGFLGAIDLGKKEAYVWGDGNEVMDFTTYADTAAFTAEAAMAPGPLPTSFNVAGDQLTFHQLIQETEAGLGHPITVKQMGTLPELDTEIVRRQQSEPGNVFSWLPLMYWRAMLNGTARLGPLVNNQYPHITPLGVQDYVRSLTR